MFGEVDRYLIAFLVGLLVTYLLTPLVRGLAIHFGVVDMPSERRPHKRPTARGGGLAVVLGVHAACLAAVFFPGGHIIGQPDFNWWKSFALSSAILVIVGIVDDVRGMKPLIKLAGQILAALLIWFSGTHFGQILGHELPPVFDCVLTVLWLVAIINAFNLIDGLDGLASGLAIISAVGLSGMLLMQQTPGQVLLLLGFIGACLGFLRYNFHPASVFLGDTGSMFIGFTLGVVSLQTFNKNTFLISMTIPIMVLGVPIYDALLAIWRRSVRAWISGQTNNSVKRGIMQPDLEHLHHRLIKSGFSTQRVATVLYVLNGGLVAVGLLIMLFQSHAAGIFLIALLAGVYVLMRQLAVIELRETGRALLMGLHRPTHTTFKALVYPVWDMVWLSGSLALIMWYIEDLRVNFWHTWFVDLPIWVTPTFSLLAMSRTYVTHWPRARLRDVLMVLFWLEAGILFSLGLALTIDPAAGRDWFLRAVLVAGISHPIILGSRLFYRSLEELVLWFKRQSDVSSDNEQVLLYGAGLRAQLFLKDRAMRLSRQSDGRNIVGIIDDETALHFQWVYGFLVLGGLNELPHLIERHKVTAIIIASDLRADSRAAIQEASIRLGLKLSEWCPSEHPVCLQESKKVTAESACQAKIN
jgi:UDP-N-acetylmuramyl pentapeptide phosphotransferase/UDP-N-acetylglucosamine-1-phosphate transferase